MPKLSAPLSAPWHLVITHCQLTTCPTHPVYLLSSPGNAANGSSVPQQLRGTNAYVYTQLWHVLPAKDTGHTKKEKKNPNLLHAPLIKRPRELKSGPKRKENAGLIYEAFRCLDGSLHPCSGNAAVQCASRLTVLQHPGALL